MDEINFEEEFTKLTEGVHIADPEIAISLFDIAYTLESVHEACAFLAEYMKVQLSLPENLQLEFPDDLVSILPHFRRTAEVIADEMHAMFHIDCEECLEDESDEEDM